MDVVKAHHQPDHTDSHSVAPFPHWHQLQLREVTGQRFLSLPSPYTYSKSCPCTHCACAQDLHALP